MNPIAYHYILLLLFPFFLLSQNIYAAPRELKISEPIKVAGTLIDKREQLFPTVSVSSAGINTVVWQQGNNYYETESADIFAARFNANGKALDSTPIPICTVQGSQERPQIAASDKVSLVVWNDFRNKHDWDIYGARITSDGQLLDPGGFLIAGGQENQAMPAIASAPGGFLVVWQDFSDGRFYRLKGVLVTNSGQAGKTHDFKYKGNPLFGGSPVIALNGNKWLLSWINEKDWTKKNGLVGITTRWFGVIQSIGHKLQISRIQRSPSVHLGKDGGILIPGPDYTLFSGWAIAGRGNRVATAALFAENKALPENNPNKEIKRRWSGWNTKKMILPFGGSRGIDGPVATAHGNNIYLVVGRSIYRKGKKYIYRLLASRLDNTGARLDGPKQWPIIHESRLPTRNPNLSGIKDRFVLVYEQEGNNGMHEIWARMISNE